MTKEIEAAAFVFIFIITSWFVVVGIAACISIYHEWRGS